MSSRIERVLPGWYQQEAGNLRDLLSILCKHQHIIVTVFIVTVFTVTLFSVIFKFRILPRLVTAFGVLPIIDRVKSSQLAHNTSWMLIGQVLSVIIQAVYFILIARSLGPQGYGAFISATALVGIFGSLTNLGVGDIMIMNVARNPLCFSSYWGKVLLINLIVGAVFLIIVLSISQVVFSESIPFALIFLVTVSDLLLSPILEISRQAFQAFQRLSRTALIQIIPSLLRLVAIGSLAAFVQIPTVLHWGYLYLAGNMISASIAIWLVNKELGSPCFSLKGIKTDVLKGLYFFVSILASNINTNIDKLLLTHFYDTTTAGIYGAAYRVIDVAFSPILSLLSASYARFFQHGERGVRSSARFAKKIFPYAAVFGLFIWVLLIVVAPIFPQVLGKKYNNLVDVIILLAPVPFLKTIYFFAADSLTGAGFQRTRSRIQVIAVFCNVGLNLWLIPSHGWRGAVWASITTEGILASLVCLALLYFIIKEKRIHED